MNRGAQLLRDWIRRRNVTASAAAFELGFTKGYMSQLLGGDRKPGRDLALKIQGYTGIGVADWDAKPLSKRGKKLSGVNKSTSGHEKTANVGKA